MYANSDILCFIYNINKLIYKKALKKMKFLKERASE